jgi:hypothetical protein
VNFGRRTEDARRAKPGVLMVGVAESTPRAALRSTFDRLGRRTEDARRAKPGVLMVGVAESTP